MTTASEFRAQSAAWYRRPSLFAKTDHASTKPRYARPGDRYGELTILEDVGRTVRGGVIWKCRCDCGRHAYRTTAALNQSVRNEHVPCCCRCLQELNAGRRVEYLDRRHDQMLDLWFERRTLWSHQEVENLKTAIMNDLEEEICPVRDEEPMPVLEPWFPIRGRDIVYARKQMEENHERADWERDASIRSAEYERKRIEKAASDFAKALEDARRLDEVRALELLAYTMSRERGFTKKDIQTNVDRWQWEGGCPRGNSVQDRAARAQMIIDGLLAYDKGQVHSNG